MVSGRRPGRDARWCLVVGVMALLAAQLGAGAPAQAQLLQWTRQFGTTVFDTARGVAVDVDGNVYVAGHTDGALTGQTNAGSSDAYLRKLNANGVEQWTRQFGTTAFDFATAVAQDGDGSSYVAGYTTGVFAGQTALGFEDVFLRKYDSAGTVVWTRQFGTSESDYAHGVAVDQLGNIYVVGETGGTFSGQSSFGGFDAFVRKYDNAGNVVWTRQFGSAEVDEGNGVAVDSSGNVLVGGATLGALPGATNAGLLDAFVRKYDSAGNVVWTSQFGTTQTERVNAVATGPGGVVYVGGLTNGVLAGSSVSGINDVYLRKYDSASNVLWTRQFGTTATEEIAGLAVNLAGNVIVAGSTDGTFPGYTNAGGADTFVRSYDANGIGVWTNQFGSPVDDRHQAVAADANGFVVAVGRTDGALPGQTAVGGLADAYALRVTDGAPDTGLLRVTTAPAVPSLISINGVARDYWGLTWLKLVPGAYTVSFGPVAGYATPAAQQVNVVAGQTTTVVGNFTQLGYLQVQTNPPAGVAGQISVDGVPRNNWGAFLDFSAGQHTVCFGPLAGFTAPTCQTPTATAGQTVTVTGAYTVNAGGPGCSTCGLLRVTTTPAVPGLISIDGQPRDYWGLTWLELPAGAYTVAFSQLAGYGTPIPQNVMIVAGQTTTVTGAYTPWGFIRVQTQLGGGGPAADAVITIDGVPRNNYGAWPDIAPGTHQVCFGLVSGYVTPACQVVNVFANQTTNVTGTYTPVGPNPPPPARPAPPPVRRPVTIAPAESEVEPEL